MGKVLSFAAGLLTGSLVGAASVLLLTPASGDELIAGARARWEEALESAQEARQQTEQSMLEEFERRVDAGKLR